MSTTSNYIFHVIFLIANLFIVQYDGAGRSEYKNHKALQLTDQQIVKIAQLSNVGHFESILDKILIPRVVGTPGHDVVKQHITTSMEELGWNVDVDTFQDNTPRFGRLTFHNLIATLNPNAKRYLALACHYDSKYFREGSFVGATDSAVPCAMMINLAQTMMKELGAIKNHTDLSLKLIFFDGEEAFVEWGPTDSIYGARHLADKWSRMPGPIASSNYLESLDLIVLLDLLGAKNPHFFSFFAETEPWYRMMVDAEKRLMSLRPETVYSKTHYDQRYFNEMSTNGAVEDDHIPFKQRGVPIVHLIPMPFPSVWHKQSDNRRAVNMPTVENLNKILRVFTASYLQLQV